MEIPIDMKTFSYKMVILGHYSVGKSSIVSKFVKNEFNPKAESTIGASFLTKTIFQNRCAIKYEIWDTAGQERYYSLIPMYYRGAQVALVVYDITSKESFESAKRWIEELKYDKPQDFLKVLVANKVDLNENNSENINFGREYAEKEGLMFFETSAKTGLNIQKMFSDIAEVLPRDIRKTINGVKLKRTNKNIFCC